MYKILHNKKESTIKCKLNNGIHLGVKYVDNKVKYSFSKSRAMEALLKSLFLIDKHNLTKAEFSKRIDDLKWLMNQKIGIRDKNFIKKFELIEV